MARSAVVLEKQPYEERLFEFDFSSVFATDDPVSSASILPPELTGGGLGTLVVGSAAWSGQRVQALFSGGADGERYLVTCRAITASERAEIEGILVVQETP